MALLTDAGMGEGGGVRLWESLGGFRASGDSLVRLKKTPAVRPRDRACQQADNGVRIGPGAASGGHRRTGALFLGRIVLIRVTTHRCMMLVEWVAPAHRRAQGGTLIRRRIQPIKVL